jgi:hypothetical protein|tara:strand:+ start:178 stop:435 length:258 start_codon:yes stop_codon:yes gene_type:complete
MRNVGFTCGPFADVVQRIEDFGTALYFAQLYYDTMMEHQKLTVKLLEAQKENDSELIKDLEQQICFIEHACQITDLLDLPYSENN